MENELKIAGIVLSGGLSSRMGTDKAGLILKNKTLLARAVELLEESDLARVFVSGDYEGFNSIPDLHKQAGPLGGLHACANKLSHDYDALFVMPVDMPLLTRNECKYLLEEYKKQPQGVYFQASTFPFIIHLNEELQKYLAEVLTTSKNKQRSLYRLFKQVKLQPIEAPKTDLAHFQNSNTPQEWEHCQTKFLQNKEK